MGEWHRVTGVCEASGEGQPSVCEYMEKLVRDQVMFGGWGEMGLEKCVDSPCNGNNGGESVRSSFPFPRSAYQLPAKEILCQALVLNPLKVPLLLW